MNNPNLRATILYVAIIVALHIIGFLTPSIFTWGVHFLGFLPRTLLVVYFFLIIIGVTYILKGVADKTIERMAGMMTEQPVVFLSIASVVFVLFAFLLRIKVPLLGDSFLAVKVYAKTSHGAQYLLASHSPLSLYYFYPFISLLDAFEYPEMLTAFLMGDIVIGIGFIVTAFFTVRNLFEKPTYQCLSFLLLVTLPYMQLLFGYVELYAVVLMFLSLYILTIVLYLREKIHFSFPLIAFTLVVLAHYMNLLLLPSLLYLGVLEYKRTRFKQLAVSGGILAGVILLALIVLEFNIEKFVPPNRGTPILTITPSDNAYQAYTLFSPYHFSDLLNLAVLLCPSAFFLIGMVLLNKRAALLASPPSRCLFLAALPVVAFVCAARFDIPMAQDWDVSASFAYLLVLYGLVAAEAHLAEDHPKVLSMIVLVTVLCSASWWYLNSTTEPNIARLRKFLDTRISSHDGMYQSTYHLGEYYIRIHDMNSIIETSEEYLRLYPTDKRMYSNYTLYLSQFGKPMERKIDSILTRWLAIDSTNPDAREQYANFHLDVADRSYKNGEYALAMEHYKTSIEYFASNPEAYNGLGICYRKMGNNDSALILYRKTLELDSANVYAYINLGNLYDERGNPGQAIAFYTRALRLQPNSPQLHYNMGVTYFQSGDTASAVKSLQQAARLGDADAQALLRNLREPW